MTNKLCFLFFTLLTFLSCKDSETFVPDPNAQSFKASAFVEVVDPDGNPLPDVSVRAGNVQGATNEDGILWLRDIDMYPSTYFTAEKPGFFHGSRRFHPTAGKTHFVQIMLMPGRYIGSFQANGNGSAFTIDGKVSLQFPGNAISTGQGEPYFGEVRVSAQPISADDADLSAKMPGALLGINSTGDPVTLGSFGMVAVELTTPDGEQLQVKSGSTVEMRMQVPASMLSGAPATIPMWYFDEDAGFWKEEGQATLTGNEYVAQLPHFSFWNCDAWFELVQWGATFVYDNGEPASQLSVCLNILSLNTGSCAFTDNAGHVEGSVAANEVMLLEVRSPCGEVIYSQQIGPYSTATTIGPITIPSTNVSYSDVTGTGVDCNAAPVTHGFAKIKVGDNRYFVTLDDETGAFGTTVINCHDDPVNITVYDVDALKQSVTLTFPFAPAIDAGTVTVCDALTELIDLEVVGLPDHVLFYFPETNIVNGSTTIFSLDSTSNFQFCYFRFPATTEGTYNATGAEIGFQFPNGDRAFATNVVITVTHYGAVGDYIIGTLTGTWHTGPNGQGGPDYPLQGSFSVLRE